MPGAEDDIRLEAGEPMRDDRCPCHTEPTAPPERVEAFCRVPDAAGSPDQRVLGAVWCLRTENGQTEGSQKEKPARRKRVLFLLVTSSSWSSMISVIPSV